MLAARLGAWLRNTGEKWARTSFAEKLALLLALLAVIYTVVTGAAELRYQARAREALAQIKAARLAATYGCAVADSNQAVLDQCEMVLICLPAAEGLAILQGLRFRAGQSVCSAMAGARIDALRAAVAPAWPREAAWTPFRSARRSCAATARASPCSPSARPCRRPNRPVPNLA